MIWPYNFCVCTDTVGTEVTRLICTRMPLFEYQLRHEKLRRVSVLFIEFSMPVADVAFNPSVPDSVHCTDFSLLAVNSVRPVAVKTFEVQF